MPSFKTDKLINDLMHKFGSTIFDVFFYLFEKPGEHHDILCHGILKKKSMIGEIIPP